MLTSSMPSLALSTLPYTATNIINIPENKMTNEKLSNANEPKNATFGGAKFLGTTKLEHFTSLAMQGLLANSVSIQLTNKELVNRSTKLACDLFTELDKPVASTGDHLANANLPHDAVFGGAKYFGLTKREHLASTTMQSLLTSGLCTNEEVAERSVQLTDELLLEQVQPCLEH
jgi:hypothetical protein